MTTETTTHTPGPWIVSTIDDVDVENRQVYSVYGETVHGDKVRIATEIGFPLSVGGDTAEANARLISAAPGLLAACKDALCHLEQGDDEPGDNMTADRIEARDLVRAAIAKARGEVLT